MRRYICDNCNTIVGVINRDLSIKLWLCNKCFFHEDKPKWNIQSGKGRANTIHMPKMLLPDRIPTKCLDGKLH